MYRVRIKKLPNKAFGGAKTGQQTKDGALSIQPTAMGGADIDQYIGEKPKTVQRTLKPVPRDEANVEVEKNEIVAGDLNGDGMMESYVAGGKRHSQGGTPLNLPDDTFIFSDTASMRIKDPVILSKFGKTSGSYTPADLAKQYDLNKYRKILQDPESDTVDKKTAEIMIRNYTMKLGALALAQESKKGFPQGIPMIAKPYMEANGISEEQLMPQYQPQFAQREEAPETTGDPQEEVAYDESMPSAEQYEQMEPMAAYGMQMGGYDLPFAQEGIITYDPYNRPQEELDKANAAYMERTKDIVLPKFGNETSGMRFVREMNEAKQMGYANEPWFNMGMKGPSLQNYYNAFDSKGTWRAPKQERIWDPSKKQFGGLMKAQDGASVKPKISDSEKQYVDEKWNGDVDAYLAFKESAQAIQEDTDFQDQLFKQYQNVIKSDDYYTGKKQGKDNWYSALEGRDKKEVVDALLAQEERNARLKAYGLDPYVTSQSTVKGANTNKEALELIKNTPGLQDLDFSKGYLSQAAYIAYDDLVGGDKGKQKKSKQIGYKDELAGRETISGIDNASTNTTLGQRLYYVPKKEKAKTQTKTEVQNQKPGERQDLETMPFAQPPTVTYPGWTAPDIRNYFGTIKDKARVKKYYPWAAPVDLEEATPVYLDPTRELAAQSEQANMLTQSLAQFVGPQGLSSRTSGIQGVGAKQAADTLSRYNNANIGIANQFASQNAQIRNQERLQNQAIAKDLYDKTVFTNQSYDNAMAAADQAQRLAFATGWKNASDIAGINATSNQYDVDPFTGAVVFQGGKNVTPERSATFNSLLGDYLELGFKPETAVQAAKAAMGTSSGGYPGIDALAQQKKGGSMYVMGDTIFPFMFY